MKLKELRQKHNLTQKNVAEKIGTNRANYNRYELENGEPDVKTLIKLADFYKVSLDEIVGREYSNTLDKSKLNETEINLINLIQTLDDNNKKRLEGYAMALWKSQQDEQITIQNLKNQYPNATFEIIDKKKNKQ